MVTLIEVKDYKSLLTCPYIVLMGHAYFLFGFKILYKFLYFAIDSRAENSSLVESYIDEMFDLNLIPSSVNSLVGSLFADCPQVQCMKRFNATEPDELGLEDSDVINFFKKMADGRFFCHHRTSPIPAFEQLLLIYRT